jgi:Cu+-exporting ATPase
MNDLSLPMPMVATQRLTLPVGGMSCASCVAHVERALAAVPGVQKVAVNLATETAAVEGAALEPRALRAAVAQAGYDVPTTTLRLALEGMSCASCVARIERALAAVPGVLSASVNLATEVVKVEVIGGTAAPAALRAAVAQAGYEARLLHDAAPAAAADSSAGLKRDALLALLLAAPLVTPMLAAPFGLDLMLPPWLQWLLATPVQFWCARRFYVAAYKAVRAGSGNMDLLVSLGTLAAYGLSLYLWWQHAGAAQPPHLYFEAAAVVIALVLAGKWLEARAKRRTAEAIRLLGRLRPEQARVRRNGTESMVAVDELRVGDTVIALLGERIAADGVIRAGQTAVDESLLTGESLPVDKEPGARVATGALNVGGRIEIEVTAVGAETMLARIVRLVEDAQAAKAPIQRLVDQVAAVFVPVVLVIAAATVIGWLAAGAGAEVAIVNAVSVLVIACPCALGLATPAAIIAGTGVAARQGILIRDPEALETARRLRVVAFDKTGTLTVGKPQVKTVEPLADLDAGQALALAAAVNRDSTHPLAAALRAHPAAAEAPALTDLQVLPGQGVAGRAGADEIYFGNERLMQSIGLDLGATQPRAAALAQAGQTLSWLARKTADGRAAALALIGFADPPKPGARAAIEQLHALGIETVMLTGDNPGAAAAVAQALGVARYEANVLPQDKLRHVQALKRAGAPVAMVGDGINDAPALAAADLGIAMGTGTDVAMHAAGITLMRGDPQLVAEAIAISRATVRKIRQNLFWAFAYNVLGIPLAAFGLLSPVFAGAAMAASSVSVVTNALLLARRAPKKRVRPLF